MSTPLRKELMLPLRVQRDKKRASRPRPHEAAAFVALWNALAPPGTHVRFFPTWGRWNESTEEIIRAKATVDPAGQPVLWLEDVRGCVSAYHCEPIEEMESEVPR